MKKKSSRKDRYFAGLDIGGTTIKAMLIDGRRWQVGDFVEVRSFGHKGYRNTFEQLGVALAQLCKKAKVAQKAVAGIGLTVPAPCSKGVVWSRANLAKDWVGVDIRGAFAKKVRKPVAMTNDCNAAAYGEYLLRPGHDGGLLYVAPGTGLGGGLVLPGGTMYEGAHGVAMELGDISVPFREGGKLPVDASGREGSLEAWVSLVAIRRQLEAKLKTRRFAKHPLNREKSNISEKAFKLRDFAEHGDTLALEIFAKQASVLGFALGDLVSGFDPGLIVIGGGLAECGFRDWYLQSVTDAFQERARPFFSRSPVDRTKVTTEIAWAIGGDGAAAFGAANLGKEVGA